METNEATKTEPAEYKPVAADNSEAQQRKALIGGIVLVVVILGLTIAALVFLSTAGLDTVARVRDIFIIFLALESLLIGLTLVILIVQLARLINLLQNEIKPILDSTNETVSHLRGTSVFLSENLAEPVIKLNEYVAGLTQALQMLGLIRKKPRP